MIKVLEQFILRLHPYFNVLDYNYNWKLKSSVARKLLGNRIIQIIDVGARGFSLGEIDGFKSCSDYIGFDADQEEASKLEKSPNSQQFHNTRIFPLFVGDGCGKKVFHIYEEPGDSSSLQPDKYFAKSFKPRLKIKNSVIVNQSTLNNLCCQYSLQPDLIKIDTQGTELSILQNSGNALEGCLIVETEAEIIPMYKDQPLLHDISKFLYEKDFQML